MVRLRSILAGLALCVALPASAEEWTIFRNCSSDPCTIGVALPNYSQPGWDAVATYAGPQEAWAAACDMHFISDSNFSPDIAEGRIDCAALRPDPNRRAPVWEAKWAIFRNCNTRPCTIGVALPTYSEPGWSRIAIYDTAAEAWLNACKMHFTDPNYVSPDIDRGRVDCNAIQIQQVDGDVMGAWTFGRVDGPVLCEINLTSRTGRFGYVIESCHQNESFWRMQNGQLVFYRDDGTVSTVFTRQRADYWSGAYLLDPASGIVHYITRGAPPAPPPPDCPEGYNPYGCN